MNDGNKKDNSTASVNCFKDLKPNIRIYSSDGKRVMRGLGQDPWYPQR